MKSLFDVQAHRFDIFQRFVTNSQQSQQHINLFYREGNLFITVIKRDTDRHNNWQKKQRYLKKRLVMVKQVMNFIFLQEKIIIFL